MPLTTLLMNTVKRAEATAKRAEALADLDEVYRAVFGHIGDEPDVYADYDRCCELDGKMRRAIETLRTT